MNNKLVVRHRPPPMTDLGPCTQLSSRIPSALLRTLKIAVLERNVTIQRALIEGVGLWLKRKGAMR